MILETKAEGTVVLLTDGRANLSLDKMEGFEGSLDLEKELIEITTKAQQRNITVHTIAVGEDAFTNTLRAVAETAEGKYWIAEDYHGLQTPPIEKKKISEKWSLKVHTAPAELPSAQPTWTKESQFLHVAVVSETLFETYKRRRRAFLINPENGREARTALVSVRFKDLTGYRKRRPKTAAAVNSGEAILLDKSYRDYLGLDKGAIVELMLY